MRKLMTNHKYTETATYFKMRQFNYWYDAQVFRGDLLPLITFPTFALSNSSSSFYFSFSLFLTTFLPHFLLSQFKFLQLLTFSFIFFFLIILFSLITFTLQTFTILFSFIHFFQHSPLIFLPFDSFIHLFFFSLLPHNFFAYPLSPNSHVYLNICSFQTFPLNLFLHLFLSSKYLSFSTLYLSPS